MAKKQYWIGVASKDHVFVGVKGGFAQFHQGKKIPRQKLNESDGLTCYSPRIRSKSDKDGQSFTSVGRVASKDVYQTGLDEDLMPYRLEIDFQLCEETSLLPLIDRLSLIENRQRWGYPFRSGHLEISEEDFELLAEEMELDVESIEH